MPTYRCLSGETITYPDQPPEIAEFLERAKAMAADETVGEPRMYQLICEDNPLLDRSIIPGRAIVTRAVFENPVYRILMDLVGVKQVQLGLLDLNAIAGEHTVSVVEAAKQLGITAGAVRAAITARKLDGHMRNGQWYLHPDSIALYKPSNRGRQNARPKADVRVMVGGSAGVSLAVRLAQGKLEDTGDGGKRFPRDWKKATVRTVATTEKGKTVRVYEIEPAPTPESIRVGDRFVEGGFAIVKQITNQRQANDAWEASKG